MAAYVIAQMEVHDVDMYREYATKLMQSSGISGAKMLTANEADLLEVWNWQYGRNWAQRRGAEPPSQSTQQPHLGHASQRIPSSASFSSVGRPSLDQPRTR